MSACRTCTSPRSSSSAVAALAVAMLGLVEAVSIARSVAAKSGQRIDGNQEFIGQGLANVVGSFFSSYASSRLVHPQRPQLHRRRASRRCRRCSPRVSLALIVLLVAPLAAHLPIAAMAAVLLVVAWRLIDFHHIQTIISTSRRETAVLATTFFATLFVELEFAIYVGVMLSLIIYLMRTSQPRVAATRAGSGQPAPQVRERRGRLPECPQLKIVRIDGSIYFGAVDHVGEQLHEFAEANPRAEAPAGGRHRRQLHRPGRRRDAGRPRRAAARPRAAGCTSAKIKPDALKTLHARRLRCPDRPRERVRRQAGRRSPTSSSASTTRSARAATSASSPSAPAVRPLALPKAGAEAPALGTLPRIRNAFWWPATTRNTAPAPSTRHCASARRAARACG
ncbi:MAG: SulP family inorganic anion transporter [Chromatiales bacterium]|nr:SulP family inorganic anion transporter [Chromatiales bacterium]